MNDNSQPPPIIEPIKGNEQKSNRPICSITSLFWTEVTRQRSVKPAVPMCSIASMVIQVVSILMVVAGTNVFREEAVFILLFIVVGGSAGGVMSAIMSFLRKERPMFLSELALLLTVLGPLICWVIWNHTYVGNH